MAGGKHVTENGNCDPNGQKVILPTTTTTTKKKTGKKGTGKTGKSRKKK